MICVSSRPDMGSVFYFTLPHGDAMRNIEILMVDDNPGDVMLLHEAFEDRDRVSC